MFQRLRLREMELSNARVVSPMCCTCKGGHAGDFHLALWLARHRRAGLISPK